ncbi:BQ2448_5049 [Microbotryum intermedium]|uniref:BQ2448_5049 protein n=1 Tax=Microbotryum intermedium TaxID=269621 RepID=A0A238F8E9_9BASI|nr:BQ2448_5049 [Microbotryum intermedium]
MTIKLEDAAVLASAVLAQRHDPAQVHALPLPPIELITIFCDAIQANNVTTETRVLVLKALRSSWSSEAKIHSRLLLATVPLLADTSLVVRTQASSLLIHVMSTASAQLVTDRLDTLASSITKSLSSFRLVPPTSPVLRLVSLSLRLLNAALLKLPSSALTAPRVDSVLSIIAHWIYFDPSNSGPSGSSVTAPPDRLILHPNMSPFSSSTTTSNALGAMASFLPTRSPSSKRTLSRSSSQSSLNNVISTYAGIYKSDSETDDDQSSVSSEHAPRLTSAQIRLDALAVLKTLASVQSKFLYPRWNLLLCDSAYVRSKPTLLGLIESDRSVIIKLRAARTLELMFKDSKTFLAIAEDRPTKASFTSLSSKLGAVLTELHLKLTSLLSAPTITSNNHLLLALLALVETVGNNASYARLRQKPLTRGLVKVLLQLATHQDISIALAALSGLIAVTRSELLSYDPDALDLASIARQATILAHQSSGVMTTTSGWELLSIITPYTPVSDLIPALAVFHAIVSKSDTTLASEQILFFSTLFKTSTSFMSSPPSDSERQRLVNLVRVALRHPSPGLKAATAQVLVSERFLDFVTSLSLTSAIDVVKELLDLTPLTLTENAEEQDIVAAAVCRSLGQVIKSDYFNALPRSTFRLKCDILPVLMLCSISSFECVASMASWAFANSIDVLFPMSPTSASGDPGWNHGEMEAMLNIAHGFLKTEASEPIQTNGIRSICLLLPNQISSSTRSFEEDVTHALVAILKDQEGKGVKVRWNAATGLGNWLVGLKDRKGLSNFGSVCAEVRAKNDAGDKGGVGEGWRCALRSTILDALIQVGIESLVIHLQQQQRVDEPSHPQVDPVVISASASPAPPPIKLNYKISIQCVRALQQAAPMTPLEVEGLHRASIGTLATDLFSFLDQVKGKERSHAQVLSHELRALLWEAGERQNTFQH